MHSPIHNYLAELHGRLGVTRDGAVATYIPELAKADPDSFAICLVTMDGVAYSVGDTATLFTMQSISKAFVFATALADRGPQVVARKVGVEPSGDAFNSISLDPQTGAPLNPMINAGAIATTSLVAGESTEGQWRRIEDSMAAFAGRRLAVDESVYRSESATGFRTVVGQLPKKTWTPFMQGLKKILTWVLMSMVSSIGKSRTLKWCR